MFTQNSENIPSGYEPVSLLEALNGVQPALPSAPLYEEVRFSGEMNDPLNLSGRQQSPADLSEDAATLKVKVSKSPNG